MFRDTQPRCYWPIICLSFPQIVLVRRMGQELGLFQQVSSILRNVPNQVTMPHSQIAAFVTHTGIASPRLTWQYVVEAKELAGTETSSF